jgi:hypothetical protein
MARKRGVPKIRYRVKPFILIQEVRVSNKYIPLKYLINDFASLATEWKNLIENHHIPEKELLRAY